VTIVPPDSLDIAKAELKHSFSKWDLPSKQWPRIPCLWCSYEDPLPRDLSYHMLENHRTELFKNILGIWYKPSEFRYKYEVDQMEIALDKAIELAELQSKKEH